MARTHRPSTPPRIAPFSRRSGRVTAGCTRPYGCTAVTRGMHAPRALVSCEIHLSCSTHTHIHTHIPRKPTKHHSRHHSRHHTLHTIQNIILRHDTSLTSTHASTLTVLILIHTHTLLGDHSLFHIHSQLSTQLTSPCGGLRSAGPPSGLLSDVREREGAPATSAPAECEGGEGERRERETQTLPQSFPLPPTHAHRGDVT